MPISFTQERYWAVHNRFTGIPLINIHAAISVRGELDVDALGKALNEVVRRHESLRTSFVVGDDGQPVQVIAPELRVEIPVDDLSHLPADQRDLEVDRFSREQGSEWFDLSRAPLFRIRLLRLGGIEHVVLATMNHIISDGWSVQVLFQEVAQLYDAFSFGHASPLPELPIQYADYALWQREYVQGDVLAALMGYWRDKLTDLTPLELPTDRPREAGATHLQKTHAIHVSADAQAHLQRLSRSENVTMFMLLMAAYQVWLQQCTGSDDIATAFNVANRNRRETQGVIGVFTNSLTLRSDLSGDPSFRGLLARIRRTVLEAFAHQELPVELLMRELQPDDDLIRIPGVQVGFNYQQRASADSLRRHGGLEFAYRPTKMDPLVARYDLWLTVTETDHGLIGELRYDGSLFDDATIARLERQFQNLLAAIIADPDQRLSQLSSLCDREPHATPPAPAAAETTERGEAPGRDEPEGRPQDIPLIHEFAASLLVPSMGSGQSLAPLRTGGSAPPLFCIHGLGGHIAAFLPLARELAPDRPVYGLQGLGLDPGQQPHDSIEAMAAYYVSEMRQVQPRGPYLLAGWSLGGLIALEAAQQWRAAGEDVALVALFDTHLSIMDYEKLDLDDQSVIRWIAPHLELSVKELKKLPLEQQWQRIAEQADLAAEGIGVAEIRRLAAVCKAHVAAAVRYQPQPYRGRAVLFQADLGGSGLDRRWKSLCPRLRVETVPGNHYSMLRKPDVDVLAQRLEGYLREGSALKERAGNR